MSYDIVSFYNFADYIDLIHDRVITLLDLFVLWMLRCKTFAIKVVSIILEKY